MQQISTHDVSYAHRASSIHKLLYLPSSILLYILTLFQHICNSWESSLA